MLNHLSSPKSTSKAKIRGRGRGTGVGGHTTGGGMAGATIRSGYKAPRQNFEGGQNPISRRLPKYKGFTRGTFKQGEVKVAVQLSAVAELAKTNKLEKVTYEDLIKFGLIKIAKSKTPKVKVVFDQEITQKFDLEGLLATKKVTENIEKVGGKIN